MKTALNCFEKGRGTHKKTNKLFSRTKLKPVYQTEIFLGLANSVLQT